MDTGQALLASVLAAPDDDLPRLVYADWLEEQAGTVACPNCNPKGVHAWGHQYCCSGSGRVSNGKAERADFIRIQCARPDWFEDATWNVPVQLDEPPELVRACRWLRQAVEFGPVVAGRRVWHHLGPGGVVGTYERGFVGRVTCRSVEWLGGERCEWCDREPGDGEMSCFWCSGSGRTPGVGRAVCESHPVQTVTLTDREPYHSDTQARFWWVNESIHRELTGARYTVPAYIWRTEMVSHIEDGVRRARKFASADAALDAFSAALIRWAKSA